MSEYKIYSVDELMGMGMAEEEAIAYQRSLFDAYFDNITTTLISEQTAMVEERFSFIDLFAGCGGLSDGFLQTGHFTSFAHVEWEKPMCDTLKHRLSSKWHHKNADNEVIRFDIQRTEELINGFDDPDYGHHIGLNALVNGREVDVIIGGPPCQAYSLAGRIRDEHGMRNDYRNFLFESYIKVVKHYKPKYFVFENVVGLLSAAPTGEPIVNLIRKEFNKAGYTVANDFKEALFDVADFGVPQHRKRIIILGIRNDIICNHEQLGDYMLDDFYKKIIPSYKCKQKTVKEAIGDLPAFTPLEEKMRVNRSNYSHSPLMHYGYLNHEPRFHNHRDIEIFRMLAEDIKSGRNEYISTERLKQLYTEKTGKKSNIHKYYVLRENEPSNTIPAHLYKDGMRHIHPDPEQARSITVREAARLQSFDDDFEFLGGRMYQYKMIGNAVPPVFAKIIADALYLLMKKYKIK